MPDDDPQRLRAVADWQERIARIGTAQRLAAGIAEEVGQVVRSSPVVSEAILRARSDLARRSQALGDYSVAGRPSAAASAATSRPSGSAIESIASREGEELSIVDLAIVDFSDNPILDGFSKGGLSKADYVWAVETWEGVVRPGISRGMKRDDFEAKDLQRNAPALRRTVDVHDMFLGDSKIVAEKAPNGRLAITNGRHRIEVARELGITTLPMRVRG